MIATISVLSLILLSFVLIIFLFRRTILCNKGSTNIRLFHDDNLFNQEVISLIPQLTRNYFPPYWIRSRVVSTLVYGLFGRFGSDQTNPVGRRQRVNLPDGTAAVFDLFLDPVRDDPLLENIILIVVPGFSNHSASDYIRAYTEYASFHGFRVATLNHLGSACGERINPEVPRIHTYGGTGDLSAMVDYLRDKYPGKKFIGVGFSLGANILLKYLGERPERQAYFLGAQSWCQGYDVISCLDHMHTLGYANKLFDYLISKKKKIEYNAMMDVLYNNSTNIYQNSEGNVKEINYIYTPAEDEIQPLGFVNDVCETNGENTDDVISPVVETQVPVDTAESERELPSWVPRYAHQRIGREVGTDNPPRDVNGFLIEGWEDVPPFDVEEFNRQSGFLMLDTNFTRPLLGFNTVEDLYRWACCVYVMDQIKDFPVLLVNAKDDPLVPYSAVENILNTHSRLNNKAIGLITQHGSHLGFYEGLFCARRRITWMDKVSVLHARSIAQIQSADYTDRL